MVRSRGIFWGLLLVLAMPVIVRGQQPVVIENALLNIVEAVNVPAGHEGLLQSLAVSEGSVVQADDVIAVIDSERIRLDLAEAEAQAEISRRKSENDVDIRFADKSLDVAQAELNRATYANSVVANSVSASEIDRLHLVLEKTKLEAEQARHNFEIAKLGLQLDSIKVQQKKLLLNRHQIRAPLSGMVIAINYRAGEWVRVSDPVMRIVRIDRLRVEDYVSTELALTGLENRRVIYRTDLPQLRDVEFEGRIVFVHPEVNPVKSQMRFWAEIDNRGLRLRPGLQGTLTILPPE